jgi:nicotinamide mononucleotide transporter
MTLADVLATLSAPAKHVAGAAVSWTEAIGFFTGALCVWLVAKQHLWNWPIGIANNLLFLLLFTTSGLYADAGLQVIYVILSAYGWWAWRFGGADHDALRVTRTDRKTALGLAAFVVVGTAVLWALLARFTNSSVPGFDAFTTSLSLAATWGQTRKQLECWWLWIAADIVYVPLYASKDLKLTAVLYVGFLLLCINGYLTWRKGLAAQPRPASGPDAAAA